MGSPSTQFVTTTTKISIDGEFLSAGGNRIAIKSVRVKQTYNGQSGDATIKLIADSVSKLDAVSKESTSATATITINGMRIYRGTIRKVTENEDGEITIKLVSRMSKLSQTYSETSTNVKGDTTKQILKNVFENGGIANRNFKIDVTQEDQTQSSTISIEESQTVGEVVRHVAAKQSAFVFIDVKDRVIVTDNPCNKVFKPTVYKSVNKGDEDDTEKKVIVKAPNQDEASDILAFSAGSSSVEGSASKEGATADGTEVKNIQDHDSKDKKTAAQVALNEIIKNRTNSDLGTVTLIGEPRIRPYDGIKVEIPDGQAPINDLDGRFTIKNVTHEFSATNGYTTKVDLMKDMEDVVKNTTLDPAGYTQTLAEEMYSSEAIEIDPSDINGGLPTFRDGKRSQ